MKSVFVGMLCALSAVTSANAAPFPDKPVRLIVPFAAGGNADNLTRIYAEGLTKKWGQTVIVENKPGAGATIGVAAAAHAAPDGYTLLLASVGMATNQFLFTKLPYDPQSLIPIAQVAEGPNVLFIRADLPVSDVPGLIAYGKARAGALTYASSGVGTSPHLAGELFSDRAGLKMIHVPYKGASPAANDLIGGQVDVFFSVLNLMQFANAGKIRALAVTSAHRIEEVPDLPTVDEAAGTKGVVSGTWFGFFSAKDIPEPVMREIGAALREVANNPRTQERVKGLELTPVYKDGPEFAAFISEEEKRWGDVIMRQHISIQ